MSRLDVESSLAVSSGRRYRDDQNLSAEMAWILSRIVRLKLGKEWSRQPGGMQAQRDARSGDSA